MSVSTKVPLGNSRNSWSGDVFVSNQYFKELPQTWQLKTTAIYYLTVLEVRSLNWIGHTLVLLEALRENPFLVFSGFWSLPTFFGSNTFNTQTSTSILTFPSLTQTLSCPPLSVIRILVINLGPQISQKKFTISRFLTTSAKSFFAK